MSTLGNIFVVSAPSGTGKSTIIKRLVKNIKNVIFSISFTTRSPRPNEINGQDYFFVSDDTFDQMLAKEDFLEWITIYNYRYGTSKAWIQEQLNSGIDVLLDIDTHGAFAIHKKIPNVIMILLLPPSPIDLLNRLKQRGNETKQQLQLRTQHAKHELLQFNRYDYLIVNDEIDRAYKQIEAVIVATRCHRKQMKAVAQHIISKF